MPVYETIIICPNSWLTELWQFTVYAFRFRLQAKTFELSTVLEPFVPVLMIDADQIYYFFFAVAYDLFDIKSVSAAASNMASGRIEVKNSLRKKVGLYNFTVTASDMEGKNDTGKMCSTSIPVVVRVQEAINDAPEWVRPPSSNFSIDVLEVSKMLDVDFHFLQTESGRLYY